MNKLYIFLGVMSAFSSDYGIYGQVQHLCAQDQVDISEKLEVKENLLRIVLKEALRMNKITPARNGLWYGSEIIEHRKSYDAKKQVDSCVVVQIRETTNEQYGKNSKSNQYKYVNLVWEERGQFLEHTLLSNMTTPGTWISSPPQLAEIGVYPNENIVIHNKNAHRKTSSTQFTGTVQVMEAVDDHLVLTFCQTVPTEELFTVILSRKLNTLTNEDLRSVRNLLKRRGLPATSSRSVCSLSSSSRSRSNVKLTSMLLLSLTFLFYY